MRSACAQMVVHTESTCPQLPDELWTIIIDFICCTSGLWAGKELRKLARVSQRFAHRARHHPDNIIPELRCNDCDRLLSMDVVASPYRRWPKNLGPCVWHVCDGCVQKRQNLRLWQIANDLVEDDESDDTASEWSFYSD